MKTNPPQVYLQTWPTTCGVSCMMMVLNHILGTPLTRIEEGGLRKDLKMSGYGIIPVISLALYMKQHGLEITVRHDAPFKFWMAMESAPEDFADQMRERYRIAESLGLRIQTGDVTREEIAQRLTAEELLVLGTELDGGVKHAILLYALEGDGVSLIDPLHGRMIEPLDKVLAHARMDVGTWFISTRRRDPQDKHQ